MTESPTTKKLPVSTQGKGEFLVPCPHSLGGAGFLDIATGKPHSSGALSYLGKEIRPAELLCRLPSALRHHLTDAQWIGLLSSYLLALQSFKIGNVLKASCPDVSPQQVVLKLLAPRPKPEAPRPRMPK